MIPIYDASVPVACSATAGELSGRIEQIERMRTALARLERTPHGLLLCFPNEPGIDDELRSFAVDEQRCCSFWGFEIETQDDQLVLRWDGPPATEDFFELLVALFEGDEPMTAISGLL